MRAFNALTKAAACLVIPVAMSGCATMVHMGGSQKIPVTSTPSEAMVTVDGAERGETPLTINLSRKHEHVIELTRDGFEPATATLDRKVSAWVYPSVVFGLVGLVAEAATGGMYYLTPDTVDATLIPLRRNDQTLAESE